MLRTVRAMSCVYAVVLGCGTMCQLSKGHLHYWADRWNLEQKQERSGVMSVKTQDFRRVHWRVAHLSQSLVGTDTVSTLRTRSARPPRAGGGGACGAVPGRL
jgi:hypothetical protein